MPAPDIVWLREFEGILREIPPVVQDEGANATVVEIMQQSPTDRTTTSTINFFFTQPPFATEYTCHASNLLGTVQATAVLTIQGEVMGQ